LARRFPDAAIIAVDKSAAMLHTTHALAQTQGLTGRISTAEADLDETWPNISHGDLAWASSSLHELTDPERTMRDIFAGLNPGGLLMVIEMDSLPSFLPAHVLPGLETRLHAALAQQGWNAHPDWAPGLERSGFTRVQRRRFPTSARSTPELTARYARTFLDRIRRALAGLASPEDLAALDILLADGPESLERRADLEVRGSRTAWAARKA
jgi:SAM-dependent methyltransferase